MSAPGPAKRNYKLRVWRQKDGRSPGRFAEYEAKEIPADASFLEMLDIVNEGLTARNEEPVAFDHDCREGICGMCSLVINGTPHGPNGATTTCQLYMRHFADGQTIVIEPFRAKAFPVLRDLIVNRSALDRIQQAGGFICVRTGSAQDANSIPIPKPAAEKAMDAAACIQCGACHTLRCCRRVSRSGRHGCSKCWHNMMRRDSGIAETTTSARRSARRKFRRYLSQS